MDSTLKCDSEFYQKNKLDKSKAWSKFDQKVIHLFIMNLSGRNSGEKYQSGKKAGTTSKMVILGEVLTFRTDLQVAKGCFSIGQYC